MLKKMIAMLLVVTLLLGSGENVSAAETKNNDSLAWTLSNISLGHQSISFTISDVESAQDAAVVVTDNTSGNVVYEKDFSITSTAQNVSLDVTEGYLPSGSYIVYVRNVSGEETSHRSAYVSEHDYNLWMTGDAYPNCYVGSLSLKPDMGTPKVTANISFQDYEGSIDTDGNVRVEYPAQSIGTIITFTACDEFGCEYTFKKTVEDVDFSKKTLAAWHTGVSLKYRGSLEQTQRLCAKVDGTTYYSEYGAAADKNDTMILQYPSTDASTVTIWYESQYGSKSEEYTLEVEECSLEDCTYEVNAYQFRATGSITQNTLGQKPTQGKVNIEGVEYSANISEDGTFSISYPSQENLTYLTFVFVDEHGCSYTLAERKSVSNSLELQTPSIDAKDVLPTSAKLDEPKEGVRLVAQIGNDTYYGEYGQTTVTYPFQETGTPINFWLEAENSNLSRVENAKVYSGGYILKVNARTGSAEGDIYQQDVSSEYNSPIISAYVKIGEETYDCDITEEKGADWEDDYEESVDVYYHIKVNYPLQKVGTTITFYYTDANQITGTKEVTLKNIAPTLKLNKVNSSTRKITGTTTAKSKITIMVGKKKYKCKANASGIFSVKIKEQKSGTTVSVLVVTPEGYTKQCSTKVKQSTGTLWITSDIFRTSRQITVKLTNAKKGDKVQIKAANKTYTKTIRSNKKTQTVTISMAKTVAAGKYIKATLYDKFHKKKDSEKTMVYYANAVYKGMSAANAELTTWGRPVRKNDYGWGTLQWVYQSANTTRYAYIKNGKVVNIQKFNY